MSQVAPTAAERTDAIIHALFTRPPLNEWELRERLSEAHRSRARSLLVDRLSDGDLCEEQSFLIIHAFDCLGVRQQQSRLQRLLDADRHDLVTRTTALAVLMRATPEGDAPSLFHTAGLAGSGTEFVRATLRSLLWQVFTSPEGGGELVDLLHHLPPEEHDPFLSVLEAERQREGLPASVVYEHVLRDPYLSPFHQGILDILAEEGGSHAVSILEQIRDTLPTGAQHRQFQGALLRLRTAEIHPGRSAPVAEGQALVSPCNALGVYHLFVRLASPGDSWSLVGLTVKAAEDIQDGFLAPRRNQREASELWDHLQALHGPAFASVDLAGAGTLVAEAARRSRSLGRTIPEAAQLPVALVERYRGGPRACSLPEPEGRLPNRTEIRELFRLPAYEQGWSFDAGDLRGVLSEAPEPGAPQARRDRWLEQAAAHLDTPAMRRRLTAVALHMARWHRWRGESQPARTCVRAATQCERSLRHNPLVDHMLRRAWNRMQDHPVHSGDLGDPLRRQHLRDQLFPHLQRPRGRDLAELDHTEAALVCLDSLQNQLPGEQRLRPDRLEACARELGRAYARAAIHAFNGGDRIPSAQLVLRMSHVLSRALGTRPHAVRDLAESVVLGLGAFTREVCRTCPVSCLSRPDDLMPNGFYRAPHPGLPADLDSREALPCAADSPRSSPPSPPEPRSPEPRSPGPGSDAES